MMDFYEQEESSNIKDFIIRLLSNWYWIAICGMIGLMIAFFITKRTPDTYKMNTTLLVLDDKKDQIMNSFFDGITLNGETNLQNHVSLLKSYTLTSNTLKNLNWYSSWYKSGVFRDVSIYKKSPMRVEPTEDFENPIGAKVYVYPIDDNTYKISVDTDEPYKIEFESIGTFGKVFTNKYFSFTIYKETPIDDSGYYFIFNNINSLTLKYLRRMSVVLLNKKADIIRVEVEGTVPSREVDFLNELVNVYTEFGLKQKNEISENMVRFIDAQMAGIIDSLKTTSKLFTDFRSKNKTIDLTEEARLAIEKVEKVDSEQFMAQMRRDYYKNLEKYLKDASKLNQIPSPSVVGIVDANLNSMIVRLADLYNKKGVISTVASDKNPSVIIIEQQINQLTKLLEENVRNLISNAEIELKALQSRKILINKELSSLPVKEQKLIDIRRNFDLNNELYTFLLKKRSESAITTASNVADVQVIDIARESTAVRVGPKKLFNLIIGFVLGVGFPLVFFALKDYFNNTIRSIEELEKLANIQIFGEISHKDSTGDLQVIENPRSLIAENFREVRTNLHYTINPSDKVIGVNSVISGEGKTFISCNLASVIAMGEESVLLIDCNLRKPSLHKYFNISNGVGLSNLLRNEAKIEDVVIESSIKNISIICAGPKSCNTSELLGKEEFKSLIDYARNRYRYIIIDNAPISLVTDGVVASRVVDINLFVLRQGYSKKDEIKYITERISKGLIINAQLLLNDIKNDGITDKNVLSGDYYDNDIIKKNIFKSL